jgi:hypothetical protein
MYVSFLGISGALHLAVFEQPLEQVFFSNLLDPQTDISLQDVWKRKSEPQNRRISNNEGRREQKKSINFIIRNSVFDIRYSIFSISIRLRPGLELG